MDMAAEPGCHDKRPGRWIGQFSRAETGFARCLKREPRNARTEREILNGAAFVFVAAASSRDLASLCPAGRRTAFGFMDEHRQLRLVRTIRAAFGV